MPIQKEYVFRNEVESCHASTILEISGGRFLAACFEGSGEGKDDVCIRIALRENDSTWRFQKIKVCEEAHWNPVLFRLPDRRIALYFKIGRKIADWQTYVAYSEDEGFTWSSPRELVRDDHSGGRGPVKNKPVLLHSGMIAAPASVERTRWSAAVDLSYDGGKTWPEMVPIPMPDTQNDEADSPLGVIQPSIWESAPGRVHMLLRSNNHKIYRSDSIDGGKNWCVIYPTGLPNNNSGIDLVKTPGGTLLLVCNPCAENWGSRKCLAIFVSMDNGVSWKEKHTLEDRTNQEEHAEFSYPAIITTSRNEAAVVYTFNRKNIAFVRIPLEELG